MKCPGVLANLLVAAALLAAPPLGAQDLPDPSAPPALPVPPASPAPAERAAPTRGSAAAQAAQLDVLFAQLARPDITAWEPIEEEIWALWAQSGSAAMDLLLQRGHKAMEAGDVELAIAHFTALTDHAPDFAEGWNARATAFFGAGLYGPALADIRRTLALNPRHFAALSGLGLILEETGDEATALAAYRAALSIHPHRPNLIEAVRRLERKVSGTKL
jgi:tetratricopeptide (TPR) repeat protein